MWCGDGGSGEGAGFMLSAGADALCDVTVLTLRRYKVLARARARSFARLRATRAPRRVATRSAFTQASAQTLLLLPPVASYNMPKNILAEMGSQVGLTPARQNKKVSLHLTYSYYSGREKNTRRCCVCVNESLFHRTKTLF